MAKTKWVADPAHSELLFRAKHLMMTRVKGEFRKFTAVVEGEDFTSAPIRVNIDASSVFTNNDDRDKHLRSADFFDVEKHPQITFAGTSVSKVDDTKYTLTGKLTIRGISKDITLDVEYGGTMKDPYGNEKAGFSLSGNINRKEWGLNWNAVLEAGGVLVSDEIMINGEVQFVKLVE